MNGETRPKRHMLCSANSPGAQAVSANIIEGEDIPINCLPLGLSSTSRVFTKIMRPVIAWLRQLSCWIITYIDDNLIMSSTEKQAHCLAVALLEAPGFVINRPKFILQPCQELQFLGFVINSKKMTIRVPPEKLLKIRWGKRGSESNLNNGKKDSQFGRNSLLNGTGHSTSTTHSFYRALQLQQVKNAAIHGPLGLTRCTDTDIPTLEGGTSVVGGASSSMELSITLSTQEEPQDSNTSIQDGLGCLLPGRKSRGMWSIEETEFYINYLELLAALSSDPNICEAKNQPYGLSPAVQCDSTTACQTGMELVHGKRDITHSRSHFGEGEYDSRLGITSVQG